MPTAHNLICFKALRRSTAAMAALVALSTVTFCHAAFAVPCDRVHEIANDYFDSHLVYSGLDDHLIQRTAKEFRGYLDPNGIWLQLSDDAALGKCARRIVTVDEDATASIESMVAILTSKFGSDSPEIARRKADYVASVVARLEAYGISEDAARDDARMSLEAFPRLVSKRTREDWADDFLSAFCSALDPHSEFVPAYLLDDDDAEIDLSYEYIGRYPYVTRVGEGAAAAEFHVGDRITSIQDLNTANMSHLKFFQGFRIPLHGLLSVTLDRLATGTPNLAVCLRPAQRKRGEELFQATVQTKVSSGKSYRIGRVRFDSFYQSTSGHSSTSEAVKAFLAQNKLDGLVLDLSSNCGGYLNEAVAVAGLFLRKAKTFTLVGQSGEIWRTYEAEGSDVHFDGPIVIVTSRATASAAELLTGALQDYRRALVVGEDRTFGKGTAQEHHRKRDRGTVLGEEVVSSRRTFLPGGRSVQMRGLPTDIQITAATNTPTEGEGSECAIPVAGSGALVLSEETETGEGEYWTAVSPATIARIKKLRGVGSDPADVLLDLIAAQSGR
jgi:carboxyl-terminal processing protease